MPNAVPAKLRPRSYKVVLEDVDVVADVGLHDFEVGNPQRLRINVEVWIDPSRLASADEGAGIWDYDFLRDLIRSLAADRRFNLQETLCRAIYDDIASRAGVEALRVSTRKLDIYPDCKAVGVELCSFQTDGRRPGRRRTGTSVGQHG